ncbi:hypothetical protein [Tumebacillus lipolyticus]|uniref:Uncharacterized protein n=1 Tax=Tumebacillus lipolyticus TaxID=1280370 RepID=A0ABW4ZVK5_9BACL
MANLKKWPVTIVTAFLILSGMIVSQANFAEADQTRAKKEETLTKLKKQEEVERAKLESMPASTQEELDRAITCHGIKGYPA